jgi:hypothetical protein
MESSSNLFSCSSLVCSLSFWLGLIMSHFPHAPQIGFSGVHWLAILGAGGGLAIVAGVVNYERKLWILALVLAVATFFLAMYAIGS